MWRSMHQRSSTWAGVRPRRRAIRATVSLPMWRPCPSGLYASSTIPSRAHSSSSAFRYSYGLNCTWSTTGATVADCQQLPKLAAVEVGDTDRSRISELACPLHPGPRPRRAALGPMDDVEIDVDEAETLEAPLDLRDGISERGMELRGDEHLVPRDAALAQALTDALLVAVRLAVSMCR